MTGSWVALNFTFSLSKFLHLFLFGNKKSFLNCHTLLTSTLNPHCTVVKNIPADAGDAGDLGTIPSLGQEDPLEKGMATHSSILGLENSMDRGTW